MTCSLLTLSPKGEGLQYQGSDGGSQLLVTLEGEAIVRVADLTTMLDPESAFLVPAGKAYSLSSGGASDLRLLRITLPRPTPVAPLLQALAR